MRRGRIRAGRPTRARRPTRGGALPDAPPTGDRPTGLATMGDQALGAGPPDAPPTDASLTDDRLTGEGLALRPPPGDPGARVCLVACGALAREILALKAEGGWDHLDLACLPALLHNAPERIPEAVRAKVRAARTLGYRSVLVAYADCGTGGALDRVCAEEGVRRIDGPHCYSFFDGNAAFAERGETAAFYLTDFLARQFDALVWQGLGLDRHPELLAAYFGNYEALVYLAQTDDPELETKARAAAARLGLEFRIRRTGYGELARFVARAAVG